tara:strand:+ start:282 stop:1292 length:1011 start_codon:yes stop_codon:yes gene_type:complete
MTILVTGSAGFIGSCFSQRLLDENLKVIGLDNHNDYYDPGLKEARLERFCNHPNYTHVRANLEDQEAIHQIFRTHKINKVVNLAAQAGVRYSMENPRSYIDSNIVGFLNILECCREFNIQHLVYASSSSVYGANETLPFSVHDNVDHPLSLYAASKKSNELMAHSYSNLYKIPTTGLRFFTVYGPWGRPDMALFLFTKSILQGDPIKVFNKGNHTRDFTYIDDIVEGVYRIMDNPPSGKNDWDGAYPDPGTSKSPWRVYNIGNNNPVKLMDCIDALEEALGIKAKKEFLPLQPGDVPDTFADVKDLINDFNFQPSTSIKSGINSFVDWYKSYYQLN